LFVGREQKIERLRTASEPDSQIAQRILVKRFVLQLGARVNAAGARLMAEPGLAPALCYFGGFPSTVSLYWENRAGLHAAAEFFDATDDAAARRVATERGITHVVIPLSGSTPALFHHVRTGEPLPQGFDGLASRLMDKRNVPGWLARDSSLDGIEQGEFGDYKLEYPVGVWRVKPAR